MNISEAVASVRANSKKRNFKQTFDLAVNIKGIDIKRPESKFSKEIILPNGSGRDVNVCLISDNIKFEPRIGKSDIESMERDKKAAKIFSKKYDFYICEASLMAFVGKVLGRYLAPSGRMPKLLMPNQDVNKVSEDLKRATRIRLKDSPVIHCVVGSEDMEDSKVIQNIEFVLSEIKKSLPAKGQIKNAYLKLTMGTPVKIDVKM